MGVLDKILSSKRGEVVELRKRSLPPPPSKIPELNLARGEGEPLRLICEIKLHSPSAGPLSKVLSVAERARKYEEGGASLISVLCDEPFFHGSYSHLEEARAAQSLPLLCKEFIIDESQLDAANAYGASAALLIVRCLPGKKLEHFIQAALSRGLTPLVEVYTHQELKLALEAGAQLIGVNARDLNTLEMNAERAAAVMSQIPKAIVSCHLSGVKTTADIERIRGSRADCALIGEVLMRRDDPLSLLASFQAAAQASSS